MLATLTPPAARGARTTPARTRAIRPKPRRAVAPASRMEVILNELEIPYLTAGDRAVIAYRKKMLRRVAYALIAIAIFAFVVMTFGALLLKRDWGALPGWCVLATGLGTFLWSLRGLVQGVGWYEMPFETFYRWRLVPKAVQQLVAPLHNHPCGAEIRVARLCVDPLIYVKLGGDKYLVGRYYVGWPWAKLRL